MVGRIPGRQPQVAENDLGVVIAVGIGTARDIEAERAIGIVVRGELQYGTQLLHRVGTMRLLLERLARVQLGKQGHERSAAFLVPQSPQGFDRLRLQLARLRPDRQGLARR